MYLAITCGWSKLPDFFGSMPKSKFKKPYFLKQLILINRYQGFYIIRAKVHITWCCTDMEPLLLRQASKCLLEQVRRRKIFEYTPDQQTALRSLVEQV